MSRAAQRGYELFFDTGCNKCHVIGKASTGPDLTGVLQRHINPNEWVKNWIMHPEKLADDDYVSANGALFRPPNA